MPEEQLQQIISCLDADLRISAAFLLGSSVNGRLREDSDIDIAVLPAEKKGFGSWDCLQLGGDLAQLAGRPVDLGILSTDNLIYAKEALLTGKRIFCRDKFKCELFGATALGLYAELRFDRREVENAYRA